MKKITFKIIAFLVFVLAGIQVQAQAFVTGTTGVYKIKKQGTSLYLTQSSSTEDLTYEAEAPGSDTQLFEIDNHPSGSHYSITSSISGKGAIETLVTSGTAFPAIGCKGNAAGGSGQHDQWNPTRGSGTQIFLESDATGTSWSGIAKRRIGVVGSADETDAVKLNGGSTISFDFVFVSVLSTKENVLESNELTVYPNPSNNGQYKLNIETEWSVYSLLGAELLNGKGKSIDLSAFAKGTYVLKTANSNKVLISN
ncbi:T9SS type A sorting domain-containing protein [Flavicella sediminum]|uniref:T9SS type A sorting domain-containing protein n=1 Tax=Flavicella sediminum TaxID=2585141 RepID=UPI00111D685A|nr:T9SS type A sorting domain-containing protein [Flavicella sediminum]